MGFLERYAKLQSRVIENDPNIRIEVYDDELDTKEPIMWLEAYIYEMYRDKDNMSKEALDILEQLGIDDFVHVEIVDFNDNLYFNLPENKQNACATVLFKRFIKFYKEYLDGLPVRADFMNYELQEKFKTAIERGIFPEESLELSNFTNMENWEQHKRFNKKNREDKFKFKKLFPEYLANQGITLDNENLIINVPISQTVNAVKNALQQIENDYGISKNIADVVRVKMDGNDFRYTVPVEDMNLINVYDFFYNINTGNITASIGNIIGGFPISKIKDNEELFRTVFDGARTIDVPNVGVKNIDDFFAESKNNVTSKIKRLNKIYKYNV